MGQHGHIYGLPTYRQVAAPYACLRNPVICYELRRELRFKRMLLEANVEPELEGKVMPAFICEVRT